MSSSSSSSSNLLPTDSHADDAAVELAKVWAELSRGEKTAQALESNLTSLEAKIDHLLASVESQHKEKLGDGESDGGATASHDKDKGENADGKS
ncbi:hypothetical protein LOCC1_G002090 [Lachnellula occidentalis]|uniref:Uncharacterized protein n=1 Tax=Lachnellula occidentalis TaxID=215460 RepID=A0A8H8S3F8_9HELO|nr:hypothetical protein LOCC1_G002090 [Lachnellula occidentalis]